MAKILTLGRKSHRSIVTVIKKLNGLKKGYP